ncbi:MAG TPA: hypothetical protein VFN82_00470 [Solirubrobacterales bacterium]|nr:hypothetical protein [Solirubrobacterales bacterium]
MTHRLIAVVPDGLHGSESLQQLRANVDGEGVEVRVVVPAVEPNTLRHTMGDVDEPRQEAEQRLRETLELLRRDGLEASGEVGDSDPVLAAKDALLKAPADEVLIFEHTAAQERWYEHGLLDRARSEIEPPLRMVMFESERDHDHVVEVEESGPGTVNTDAGKEVGGGHYIPGMTRADLGGMLAGILGTIIVAILAAAVTAGSGHETGWEAAAILIAIGIALANLAHVVGLTLFESVRYRGGFARFFRLLALVATPVAVVANVLILIFA